MFPTISTPVSYTHLDVYKRQVKGFEELLVDSREIAEALEIDYNFPNERKVRPRKKKCQFDYESSEEPIEDPKKA